MAGNKSIACLTFQNVKQNHKVLIKLRTKHKNEFQMDRYLSYPNNFYWKKFFQKIALSSPLTLQIHLEF